MQCRNLEIVNANHPEHCLHQTGLADESLAVQDYRFSTSVNVNLAFVLHPSVSSEVAVANFLTASNNIDLI